MQCFAEREHRQHGGEGRQQVRCEAGTVRADHLDALVPANICEERGEDSGVKDGETRERRRLRQAEKHRFEYHSGRDQDQAGNVDGEEQSERIERLGRAPQQHTIEAPRRHGEKDDQIADVELQMQQLREGAAADDDDNAAKRQHHADELARRNRFAVEQPRNRDDVERRGRIHEHRVDRGGVTQPGIDHDLEKSETEEAHRRDQQPMAPDNRAFAAKARNRQRCKTDCRHRPASERQRDRRDDGVCGAAEHPIPGPEQVAQRQQQVRIKRLDAADGTSVRGRGGHGRSRRCRRRLSVSRPCVNLGMIGLHGTHMRESVECVVIGAGVIGLAVARALALSGRTVLVVEKERYIGAHTSSRNSEIIHAGLYYPAGGLKARFCVAGRRRLYDYCAARGVATKRIGKLVVATDETEIPLLTKVMGHAKANGVDDLELLDAKAARAMEPALACVAAFHSPSTGLIDSHALMLSLQGEAEAHRATVALRSEVASGRVLDTGGFTLEIAGDEPMTLACEVLVNAAGLYAPGVARRLGGVPPDSIPRDYYCRGVYFTLPCKAPFRRPVYPVPEHAGLGVHYTPDLAGQGRFGPDTEWIDGIDYTVDPKRAARFYAAIRKYWPQDR